MLATMNATDILFPQKLNQYVTNDLSSTRAVGPTLIKSFAIHLTATASLGHLLSLRNTPNRRSTALLLYIITFLLFPLLLVAQLLRQLRSALALNVLRLRPGVTLCIGICCGVYASKSEETGEPEPLEKVDLNLLRRGRASYNYLWLGRVVILLALAVQYCGTLFLWYRRASRVEATLWAIDTRNLEMALGGLVAVMCSLVISILNTEWEIKNGSLDENEFPDENALAMQDTTSVVEGFNNNMLAVPGIMINTRQRFTTKSCACLLIPVSRILWQIERFYTRVRALSTKASNATLRIYPLSLQWDLELAYLLRVFVSVFIIPFDSAGLGVFLTPDSQYFLSPRVLYYTFIDCFYHAGYMGHHANIMMLFYLLPFVTILAHMSVWIIANARFVRIFPNVIQKVIAEIDFWFRSGHTLFSIPFSLLMLMPLYFQVIS
jgi:hypothetical protein